VLPSTAGPQLLTVDVAVAGVHGDLELIGLDDFGWRALAGAVSDIAAMGGRPRGVVVALAGPPTLDVDRLYDGLAAAAAAHESPVVGGDLSTAPVLAVAVTVTGTVDGAVVLRRGASPGDWLFVTGSLGGSAAGLRILRRRAARKSPGVEDARGEDRAEDEEAAVARHRRPRARLTEGQVAARAGASAMIDISDGLAADVGHLCEASGVGVRLSAVPVAPAARLDEALGGGEDYELVVATADPDGLVAAFAAAGLAEPVVIGRCTAEPAERLLDGEPLGAAGWEHPFG
jgi:thiamine-monophosphate kinase